MTNAASDKSCSDDLDAESVSRTASPPELLCEVVEETRGLPDGARAIGRGHNLDGAVVQKLEHNARWRITNQRRGSRQEARVVRVAAIAVLGAVFAGCATVSDHARAHQGGIDIQGHQRGVPGDICPGQQLYGPQELGFALYCWGSRT